MRTALTTALLVLSACAPGAAPCPRAPATAASAPPPATGTSPATKPAAPDADVTLVVRPSTTPAPHVHVEVTLSRSDATTAAFSILDGAPARLAHVSAHDASGDLRVDVAPAGHGVALRLSRTPTGPLTLAYDVLAGEDAPDDPLGVLVLDDRFRASGQKLVALPDGVEGARANVLVRVEGDALKASGVASSFGVGPARRITAPPRALRYASFIGGSLGVEVIDDPAAGHDEGAWLGYTAFDPRTAVAELAQVRTALRDMFKAHMDVPPWTFLVVSQTRPIGSFGATPLFHSTLLQVGPAEPWGAGLRLAMTQQLARQWVGGLVRIATPPGREAEGNWFADGVSRYAATALLVRLGAISHTDAGKAVVGELAVMATSPHKALDNAALSELSRTDPVARATLMARGALYALRESAAMRAHSKGARGIDAVLAGLVHDTEEHPRAGGLAVPAWLDAITPDDPDASKTFDALVVRGEPIALPPDALGPCFRAGTGEYVAYDPGFDEEATRLSRDGKVVGVRPNGPAAKAGLKDGDVVEAMQARDGDSSVPVKLTVVRDGAKVSITYAPRGARGRGQTWTRLEAVPEERCGDLP